MNALFEKFISRMVKELDNNVKIQNQDNFNDLILKPDIILKNQIIDTKYKKIKSIEDIKQSDKLQVFAYGVNYEVDNVMLLYPRHLDKIKYDLILGKDYKKVELKIRSIDLDFSGNEYKEYVEEIKLRVEGLNE